MNAPLQEGLDCEFGVDVSELATPAPMVSLLDKQAGVRASQADLGSAERRGLLWLLDEEALFPGATDESFVERLLLQNGAAREAKERKSWRRFFQGKISSRASFWLFLRL